MKKIMICLLMVAGGLCSYAQWGIVGGYGMMIEKNANNWRTARVSYPFLLHGGMVQADYNLGLVGGLTLRPGISFQMSTLGAGTISKLQSTDGTYEQIAVLDNRYNKEYDIGVPVYACYEFDKAMNLHFNIFAGPVFDFVINEWDAVRFTKKDYQDALRGGVCSFDMLFGMGFEIMYKRYGLYFNYNREFFSTGHKAKSLKRDALLVGVRVRFGALASNGAPKHEIDLDE